MTVAREPGAIDLAVLALAERVMDVCDPSSFSLRHVWNGSAGMWFVEIEPSGPGPASITLYHGGDTLNICLGPTWFEYWLARRALMQLRSQGRAVQSIHPCFSGHPGCWQVTRQKQRDW